MTYELYDDEPSHDEQAATELGPELNPDQFLAQFAGVADAMRAAKGDSERAEVMTDAEINRKKAVDVLEWMFLRGSDEAEVLVDALEEDSAPPKVLTQIAEGLYESRDEFEIGSPEHDKLTARAELADTLDYVVNSKLSTSEEDTADLRDEALARNDEASYESRTKALIKQAIENEAI